MRRTRKLSPKTNDIGAGKKNLSVTVPEPLKKQLMAIAKQHGVSLNKWARAVLEEAATYESDDKSTAAEPHNSPIVRFPERRHTNNT